MNKFKPYIILMKNGAKFIIDIKDIDIFNQDIKRLINKGNAVQAKSIQAILPGIGLINIGDISAVYPKESQVEG